MMTPDQVGVRPNPDYGSGIYRRRILLTNHDKMTRVELEDCSHAMRLQLRHDRQKILLVEGEVLRGPVTSCQSAPDKLADFIGMKLQDTTHYRRAIPSNQQCTHLYDMTLLAIEHCQQQQAAQQIDVAVTDEQDGIIDAAVFMDGAQLHRWQLLNNRIENPAKHRGQSVFRGFIAWVNQHFDGEAQRGAFALQRGIMVANARRWDMFSVVGDPADRFGPGAGVCYSYSEGRAKQATRSDNPTRDFTNTPEQLLRFR